MIVDEPEDELTVEDDVATPACLPGPPRVPVARSWVDVGAPGPLP